MVPNLAAARRSRLTWIDSTEARLIEQVTSPYLATVNFYFNSKTNFLSTTQLIPLQYKYFQKVLNS